MFDYKFVTIPLDRGWLVRRPAQDYHTVIQDHARQGWRLVQIFAPGTGAYGAAKYFELVLERPVDSNA